MDIDFRICLLGAVSCLAVYLPAMFGQNPAAAASSVPDWQTKAGGQMAFDVASVKPDAGPFRPPNFPLDTGDAFRPVGGHFNADFPLTTYITFAYKVGLTADQRQAMIAHLPGWVATDRFDIQAEAQGNPTKDQMRLMMQSLLAERFQLKVHFETQVLPVLAMTLAKPDKTGPKLRLHSEGVPCEATPAANGPPVASPATATSVFPPVCDVYMMDMSPNGIAQAGSRNTTLDLLASALPGIGQLVRPVVDQTGLGGRFDFSIEFTPESHAASTPNGDAPADVPVSTFLEAVREQLGLRLEATKAPLRILVVDYVDRPSQN
jgi:bla regulator protein blaR1